MENLNKCWLGKHGWKTQLARTGRRWIINFKIELKRRGGRIEVPVRAFSGPGLVKPRGLLAGSNDNSDDA